MDKDIFKRELSELLNRHSIDNDVNIPDYILTDHLIDCIKNSGRLVQKTGKHTKELSGSEAVFGFCGWLTCREAQTIMSSKDDAAIIANLVKEFCSVNRLSDPRSDWHDNLIHPKEG